MTVDYYTYKLLLPYQLRRESTNFSSLFLEYINLSISKRYIMTRFLDVHPVGGVNEEMQ